MSPRLLLSLGLDLDRRSSSHSPTLSEELGHRVQPMVMRSSSCSCGLHISIRKLDHVVVCKTVLAATPCNVMAQLKPFCASGLTSRHNKQHECCSTNLCSDLLRLRGQAVKMLDAGMNQRLSGLVPVQEAPSPFVPHYSQRSSPQLSGEAPPVFVWLSGVVAAFSLSAVLASPDRAHATCHLQVG